MHELIIGPTDVRADRGARILGIAKRLDGLEKGNLSMAEQKGTTVAV